MRVVVPLGDRSIHPDPQDGFQSVARTANGDARGIESLEGELVFGGGEPLGSVLVDLGCRLAKNEDVFGRNVRAIGSRLRGADARGFANTRLAGTARGGDRLRNDELNRPT